MVRKVVLLSLAFALAPGLLAAQTAAAGHAAASSEPHPRLRWTLEGAAGTTLGGGFVASASAGVAPASWLTLLVHGERFQLPTRSHYFAGGSSVTRGFTTLVLGGEIRVGAPVSSRVVPYVALGITGGTWESAVDPSFTRRDGGPVNTVYAGGGVRIPIRRHLSLVADARWTLGITGEDVLSYVPIKGGLAWDF